LVADPAVRFKQPPLSNGGRRVERLRQCRRLLSM